MRNRRYGSAALETVMVLPFLFVLLLGTVEIGKITYTYYTLHKIMYSLARYLGTQQGTNFCDPADPNIVAAKNFALTGTADASGTPIISNFTADMIAIRAERLNAQAGTLGECDCSSSGCDASAGGLSPDFIAVSIPNGYEVTPHILFLPADPIPLKPEVRIPYGGT
jgi:TadE-like protein